MTTTGTAPTEWDKTYYGQRTRRKSIEEIYRHPDRGAALYVRVLGGVIEADDFYDDRHYGGSLYDYYYGEGLAFGRVEHLPAAELVRVEEIDGQPANEWVYDIYVRRPAAHRQEPDGQPADLSEDDDA